MLILNRRAGEAILIDGGVRIVVIASDSGGVRLGIEAPPSVGIVREEIVERIAEENIRAGATQDQREWLEGLTKGPGGESSGSAGKKPKKPRNLKVSGPGDSPPSTDDPTPAPEED
jgi:carbon storage regulator